MPSWNVHTAHVEQVLRERDPSALGIRDANAFLFGNFVPDIYVGYMVKDPTRKIAYADTHFANPGHVPEPRFWEFWDRFGLPSANAQGHVSDVTLGTWCHLVADNIYNHNVNAYRHEHGIPAGERTRIRKQADFDLYGHTLDVSLTCEVTPQLLAQAAAFPQYAVAERDVRAAVEVARGIVEQNQAHHLAETPAYDMLDARLFADTRAEVDATIIAGLEAYAREGASAPALREERPHA